MFDGEVIKKEVIFVLNQLLINTQLDESEYEVVVDVNFEGKDRFLLKTKDDTDVNLNADDDTCLIENPNTLLFFDEFYVEDQKKDEPITFVFTLSKAFEAFIMKKVYAKMVKYEKDCINSLEDK
ncbi:MAG: hypothetical protein LIR46_06850 [Bacteroidota bacterium]|nr:hypothetical protein [Bacteroidota bacterium]